MILCPLTAPNVSTPAHKYLLVLHSIASGAAWRNERHGLVAGCFVRCSARKIVRFSLRQVCKDKQDDMDSGSYPVRFM